MRIFITLFRFVINLNIKRAGSIVALAFSAYLYLTSCETFVTVPTPIDRLATQSVFGNNATATSAMTYTYSKMVNSDYMPYYIPTYTGLLGDELTSYSTFSDLKEFYKNSINAASNTLNQGFWSKAYSYIYQANAIIDGLQNSGGVSSDVKTQLFGEAKFLRAFWHFYLVNFYGPVPVVTTTDYTVNATVSRSSEITVLQQIISDLLDAQRNLSNNYVITGGNSLQFTTERVRPNKWTATAFLARVYLYMKDYTNAENQATAIINDSGMYKMVDLNSVFKKANTEAIWQLMTPLPTTFNTVEAYYFFLSGAPLSNTFNCSTISSQLLNSFESADKRKNAWIGSSVSGTSTYNYPAKYKASGATLTEYSTVFRLAEQFLIRAEARFEQGNITGTLSDLNIIRVRAGLSVLTTTDVPVLRSAILHERQTELFCEWGHRWMDTKRMGIIDSIMMIICPLKGGTWSTNWKLFPVPQSERLNDPNLSQNQGY